MTAQQHRIMRQVLEVHGCPRGAAQRVQSELRDAYRGRLLPLIEKICSELSAPGRIHRVDALEIDLGEVPLDALESAVADEFAAAFSRRLAAAIAAAPEIDSELELFGYFIRTGTVPWWADAADRSLLQAALESLIRRAPQALRRTIQAAPDPERTRRRLVRAYSDRLLEELAGVIAPWLSAACPGLGRAWIPMLGSVSGAWGDSALGRRHFFWEEILRAAGVGDAPAPEAPRFFGAVLTRAARRIGLDYRSLVANLHRALEDRTVSVPPWTRDVTENLWRELDGDVLDTREPAASPSESSRARFMRLLERLESAPVPEPDLWTRLRVVFGRLPPRLQAQVIDVVESAKDGEVLVLSSVMIDALAALVRAALDQNLVVPRMVERYAARLRQSAPPGMPAAVSSQLGAKLLDTIWEPASGAREKDARADSVFSDADAIYVENAGLVILWPFLESFFGRLGLLEGKRFRDEAAAHRAAGLLQYVAGAEEPPPEYLLPLNKVLCGIALDEVFDFGAAITADEGEECTDLLAAVIQQAPILGEMSIPGFRGSFLLRKGQLGSRDGNWLLRVERETHDIVLDRFPWTVGVVKLPWMEALMQVEW